MLSIDGGSPKRPARVSGRFVICIPASGEADDTSPRELWAFRPNAHLFSSFPSAEHAARTIAWIWCSCGPLSDVPKSGDTGDTCVSMIAVLPATRPNRPRRPHISVFYLLEYFATGFPLTRRGCPPCYTARAVPHFLEPINIGSKRRYPTGRPLLL